MKKRSRLHRNSEITAVLRQGKRVESPLFRLHYRSRSAGETRYAFIVPRTTHKRAVLRNRIRRRAREWLRLHPSALSYPLDIILFFKKGSTDASRPRFYEELKQLITRIR